MGRRILLGPSLTLDLDRLITTRLLIQANSGGGKSWALRRLLEQTHGHVQQLVLDPEGEFATLREKYDYVLAAKTGGDTVADPRTAALLAIRLLELEVSAILDLYELKKDERKAFVRIFLEAMIEAPRKLWHPVMIYVDEAHVYCPEKEEAESSGAVIDAATRGRKRGFCLVAATQRLAKFDKDAAAELNNKLIGRTVLDDDMKRAGDELGFRAQEQRLGLRELNEGEFFAFGPAFGAHGVTRGKTGPVLTTHPKAGARLKALSPPPTSKIKALLPKLADLPAEAAERATTIEGLRRQVTQLKTEVTLAKKLLVQRPQVPVEKFRDRTIVKTVRIPVLRKLDKKALRDLGEQVGATLCVKIGTALVSDVEALVRRELHDAENTAQRIETARDAFVQTQVKPLADRFAGHSPAQVPIGRVTLVTRRPEGLEVEGRLVEGDPNVKIRKGARRMMDALARRHPIPSTFAQVAQLAGLSTGGGTFTTYCSDLRRAGFTVEEGNFVKLTELGWAFLGRAPGDLAPQTTEDVLRLYSSALRGGARRMIEALIHVHPHAMTREELSDASNVVDTGGTFSTYLSDLRRAGLIAESSEGIAASELLMDPASAA